MKKLLLLIAISLIVSCNGKNKKEVQVTDDKVMVASPVKNEEPAKTAAKNGIYLCKINGEDWAYTKASGIVSTHARTKERTAMVTFTKKLEKGSESIQLTYDADSFQLIDTSLQLKFENKDRKLFTCFYRLNMDNKSRYPDSSMAGEIDLSDDANASGTAEIINILNRNEKDKMLDPENASVTISGLKFSGVGYSDLDKISNMFKN